MLSYFQNILAWYNTIYGCREWDDSMWDFSFEMFRGYKVCTSWLDGYYLMTNTTNSGTNLSFWVPDWALANPRYINNPDTMKWIGRICWFIV